jgi:hypothetical protein
MNYQRKYLKYKLKYLNIKKMIKRGGTHSEMELSKLKELESIADYEQDKKIIKIIEKEELYKNIPENIQNNPTLPHTSAGLGLSDVDIDLTMAGNSIDSLSMPIANEQVIQINPTLPKMGNEGLGLLDVASTQGNTIMPRTEGN